MKFAPFLHQKLNFSALSLTVDPENIHAIVEMKPSTTRKELKNLIVHLVWRYQFLETCLYERIKIVTFFHLMVPLHELNRAKKPFVWTEKANKASEIVKRCLSPPPSHFQILLNLSHAPRMLVISCVVPSLCRKLTTDGKDRNHHSPHIQPNRTELVYYQI